MSVDLTLQLDRPISLGDIREGTMEVLRDLLHGTPVPPLEIYEMNRGEVNDNELVGADRGEMFILSAFGSKDAVDILETHMGEEPTYDLTFSAAGTRSASERALGLAAAIFVAKSCHRRIEDGWEFWAGRLQVEPDELLQRIRLSAPRETFFLACEDLLEAARAQGSPEV
jgi:hypothetical protein